MTVQGKTETHLTAEELFAVMDRAPDFFRALQLEDINEIEK
ncbi:MAG: hypothetical protein QXJ74_07695 [Nitrososphaera sp.]|nr:hypothetical protein [Nitrososphaera sp.]